MKLILISTFLFLVTTQADAFSTLNYKGEICHLVEIENYRKIGDSVWVMNVDTGNAFMMRITHIDRSFASSEIVGLCGIDENGYPLSF